MPTAAKSSQQASKARQKLSLEHRSRSVPFKKPFILAVFASLLFYLGLIAFVASVFAFSVSPKDLKKGAADILVVVPPVCAGLWLIAYILRRRALCPLCRSTPLLDTLSSKHEKAYKCKPLNYGTTAILSIVFTQRMRCMHCGTPFDLLKLKSDS
jgi:hypothetical protein